MLLIFGNMIDLFTDRTFDLCTMNFTMFDGLCPAGVQLTPENFFTEYSYVFCFSSITSIEFRIITCIENVI